MPMNHCAKDSFYFVKDLKSVNSQNSFTVSFDIQSLFTNVPITESVNLALELILSSHNNLKLDEDQLTELFEFATSVIHCIFKGQYYDQIGYGLTTRSTTCKCLHGNI